MTEPYYQDDLVTLYHGDCREITEWLAADVLVTDPPYGMAYRSGGARVNADGVRSVSPSVEVHGDDSTECRDAALAAWGDRPALVFGTWKVARPPGVRERLIWHKRNLPPGMGTATPWSGADEEVYVLGSGFTGERHQNVIATDEARAGCGGLAARIGHPTPKPIDLMEHLVSRTWGIVADPFAGSGSTLVAAKRLGRRAIGVELNEDYCQIIAARLGSWQHSVDRPGSLWEVSS